MSPDGSSAAATITLCPFLEPAARLVVERFQNLGDALDQNDVRDVAEVLVRRVVDQRNGVEFEDAIDVRACTVLGRRLLELIRAQLLECSSDSHTDLLIDTLRAMERVRRELEPDWSNYFVSRLAGPGALELVVEIAHDLRSPLTSILFLAETLMRGQSGEVNDVQRRQLGLMYGAALGLSSVTSDVIELVRGGDRLVDKEPAPFSITEIFESVTDIIRPIAEEKGIEVRTVPPPSDHRIGHRLALSRVLLNLTTNALKFTDQGHVEIAAVSSGMGAIRFSVRDTGRGIAAEALDTLYQPFRRTRARREYAFSGTGLGLTICYRLVEAMGSELKVETRPEWGTRFYFELDLPSTSLI